MSEPLIDRFVRNAGQRPDAPAIHWQGSVVTYRELLEKVEVRAAALGGHDDRGPVALHLTRTPELIATMLAAWYVGRAFVALDPRHPPHRQQAILAECRPAVVVHDTPIEFEEPHPRHRDVQDLRTTAALHEERSAEAPEDVAYLLYTSGSTGKPKGISIAHRSVRALVDWAQDYFRADQLRGVLASTTITFDLAIFEVFVPLATGNAVWLVDSVLDLLDAQGEQVTPTLINTVPSAARELVRARAIPPDVTTVNLAGEALSWGLVNDIYQTSAVETVNNLWGPSEDTTYSTAFCSRRSDERPDSGPVPIGYPVTGTQVFVVDEQMQTVSPGREGEICLSGVGLAKGYHNNSALTEERFPRFLDPDGNERRVYRTGDWAHQDPTGLLYFHGRMDFQVKIRGHRIELEEIEQALLAVDDVREAAVIAQSHREEHRLVAVLVSSRHDQPHDELVTRCRRALEDTLPAYMMPHSWHVRPEAMPRTTSGKVDRASLSATYRVQQDTVVLSSPVMALVGEALGTAADPDETFLAAGGDSLAAVRLRTLLRDRMGKSVALAPLLSGAERLSDFVDRVGEPGCDTEDAEGPVLEDSRLTALEYRMVKVYKTHRSPGSYNIGLRLRFDEVVDNDRVRRSTMTALARSRALASTVELDRDGARYRPADSSAVWQEIPAAEWDEERERQFVSRPFELEQEPPVRAMLVDDGERSCLLFSFAHTAVDGVGLNALLDDIAISYVGGEPPPAASVRLTAPSETRIQAATAYWQERLAGYRARSPWPQALHKDADGLLSWTLDADAREQLDAVCGEHGLTLPVLLMATLFVALHRVSGSDDLAIATPVANRGVAGTGSLVANMTNSLVVRCVLHEASTAREAADQVRQQLAGGLEWQDVAIDDVVERLSGEVAEEALFDVMFSYMDFLPDGVRPSGMPARVDLRQPARSKAPLVVSAVETDDARLRFMVEYQGDVVPSDWAGTVSELYRALLEQGLAVGDRALRDLDPVPPAQWPMLHALRTVRSARAPACLVDRLSDTVGRFGSRVAVEDGDRSATYTELWRESETLAAGLQTRGVGRGDAVGVQMPRGWRLVAVLLAVLRAGAFYVPLDAAADVRLAVTDGDSPGEAPAVDHATLAESGATFEPVPVGPHDVACVLATSGTTGPPKRVELSHRNVCHLVSSSQGWGAFDENDRWTQLHSCAVDFSVWETFGSLLCGGTMVPVHSEESADMVRLAELIDRERISVLSLTPTTFRNLISAAGATWSHPPRLAVLGKEELRPSDLEPWWRRHGTEVTRFVTLYGTTETTLCATAHEMTPDDGASCIGTPPADTGVLLRDARGLPCPVGVPGEVYVSGDGVSPGYHGAPELDEDRFEIVPEGGGGTRYHRTDDTAVVDAAGRLVLTERRDQRPEADGRPADLHEVADALRRTPGVTAAVVRAVAVNGDAPVPAAWYLSERALEPGELQSLPAWAVPERVLRVDELPTTTGGRLDESRLPALPPDGPAPPQSGEHPVQEIWRDVLGAGSPPDDLPFFEAGGTSIKAALLVQSLNSLLTTSSVSLVDIFRHPCIRDQRQMIDQLLADERT